jgi:biopolymer transport protein ExbD
MRFPEIAEETMGPNMTPIIDVVFQLLIFFLVATRFDQEERELDTILPQAAAASPLSAPPQQLIVNVRADGRYVVNRSEITEAELRRLLRQVRVDNPTGHSVLIRGDERVAWKHLARVMSLCNEAEIDNYRVAVLQER